MTQSGREIVKEIFWTSLRKVKGEEAVKRGLKRERERLWVGKKRYDLSGFHHIFVVGAGKATASMAKGLESILGERISKGIIVVKYGHKEKLTHIKVREASHPFPDERGKEAAEEILSLAREAGEDDLLIVLLSGGGSALLSLPEPPLTLKEKRETTEILLRSGARIDEINSIRKHLSHIKGGRLAKAAFPATCLTLIISDVVGDKLEVIASGPTAPDDSTFGDAWKVVKKYRLEKVLPSRVVEILREGMEGKREETPKKENPIFGRCYWHFLATNSIALQEARKKAEEMGFPALILSSLLEGEAREIARFHSRIVKEVKRTGNPLSAPCCLLSGGEATVTVKGKGEGGRNQEFALAFALDLGGEKEVLLLSAGTDGTDGPTPAAGAFVDETTLKRAKKLGMEGEDYLERNDSYNFFKSLGDLFITGPTGTNVMDLRIILVGGKK